MDVTASWSSAGQLSHGGKRLLAQLLEGCGALVEGLGVSMQTACSPLAADAAGTWLQGQLEKGSLLVQLVEGWCKCAAGCWCSWLSNVLGVSEGVGPRVCAAAGGSCGFAGEWVMWMPWHARGMHSMTSRVCAAASGMCQWFICAQQPQGVCAGAGRRWRSLFSLVCRMQVPVRSMAHQTLTMGKQCSLSPEASGLQVCTLLLLARIAGGRALWEV